MTAPEVPISEARARLGDIVRDAADEPTVITQNGRAAAVVIGIDEWRNYAAIRDALIWERIQARSDTETYVPIDDVIEIFAKEHSLPVGKIKR